MVPSGSKSYQSGEAFSKLVSMKSKPAGGGEVWPLLRKLGVSKFAAPPVGVAQKQINCKDANAYSQMAINTWHRRRPASRLEFFIGSRFSQTPILHFIW